MDVNYAEYIRVIMQAPINPQIGADIEEIRSSIRVLDALDKSTHGEINLEDADYKFFVMKIKTAKFMFVNREILQFVEDVTQ